MSAESQPAWLDAAVREPWHASLFGVLRRLAAQHPQLPRVGCARHPADEAFRLVQEPSLGFAPREIASIASSGGRTRIALFGLGLLGPNAGLPLHFTEAARDQRDLARDSSLCDFLDLFHHRALSLFYRAWAQAQGAAGLDRPHDETLTRYIADLVGDQAERRDACLPAHVRWACAGHRLGGGVGADALERTLSHLLGLRVQVSVSLVRWSRLDADSMARLGAGRLDDRCGIGAMCGEFVPLRHDTCLVRVCDLSLRQYLRLCPRRVGPPALLRLVELMRLLRPGMAAWAVELLPPQQAVRGARLGRCAHLGRSAWLDGAAHVSNWRAAVHGRVFQPERAARAQPSHADAFAPCRAELGARTPGHA